MDVYKEPLLEARRSIHEESEKSSGEFLIHESAKTQKNRGGC